MRVVAISREGGLLLSSYSRTPNNGTAAVELRSPSQKQKKPSIRAQLKAAKEEQQKKPPQREKAQELEV